MKNTSKLQRAALTGKEQEVLDLLTANAQDEAGGDFGLLENVRYKTLGLTGQQFGALVTSLQTKGYVSVHGPVETNGGPRRGGERWTQFTL